MRFLHSFEIKKGKDTIVKKPISLRSLSSLRSLRSSLSENPESPEAPDSPEAPVPLYPPNTPFSQINPNKIKTGTPILSHQFTSKT